MQQCRPLPEPYPQLDAIPARTRVLGSNYHHGMYEYKPLLATLALLFLMTSCTTPLRSNLEAFPPMASGNAPGASPEVLRVVKGLGRGVNFGGMMEAPNEGDWGYRVTREHIDLATTAGFTHVRLPVRWSNHALPLRPFTLDAAFTQRVETVVDALLAKGLYVVLDMHHYTALDGDAPADGDAAQEPGLAEERFLTLWRQLAQRFQGKSDHLIFELYNEPHNKLDAPRWNDLMARALAVVRASNPVRAVIVGPVSWNNARYLDVLRLPNDPHLIVAFHNYDPFKFTHQGAPWINLDLPKGVTCCSDSQRAESVAVLDIAKAWSDKNHYPMYLGEFGSFDTAEMTSRANFTRLMREEAEARGFPWAYWELTAHFGLYDSVARAWRQPLLQALMTVNGAKAVSP